MTKRSGFVLLLLATLFSSSAAQQGTSKELSVHRIDSAKPSLYITIDPVPFQDEKRVWLRLHNNLSVDVNFSTLAEHRRPDGEAAVLPFYEVRSTGFWQWVKGKPRWTDGPKPPQVDSFTDLIGEYVLHPGETVSFRVPETHLASGLFLLVPYSYSWEVGRNEPHHHVEFRAWQR